MKLQLRWVVLVVVLGALVGLGAWKVFKTPLPPPKTQNMTQVIKHLKDQVAKHPQDPKALIVLGNAYYDGGRFNYAVAAYRAALSLSPHHPNAIVDMGTCLLYQGMTEDAIKSYRIALQEDPDHVFAHFNLGIAFDSIGDKRLALKQIRKAFKLSTDPMVRKRCLDEIAEIEGKKPPSLEHAPRPDERFPAIGSRN